MNAIKEFAQDFEGIPSDQQMYFYNSIQLESVNLAVHNISYASTLNLELILHLLENK
ncbi:MAG: hypothetical protein GY727_05405 [Gammaproteobacteria bacterium]|nr:hypothetical protein [Gammaproteobacteria bacterium]MCP4091189.1 hypothetical protein [Gammaproteobacteria bacterium]MCP4277790.1 hypothetical protein [Gammaproteobacteria bacterium]MCP4831654.1 hypothetical protein [Gammaproteobacteria bacterium]MCP4929320.1 hypothetical protein [Gammaproteobacteria bacterium]